MLNIFILEDDFIQQTRLEKAIQNCVQTTEVKYKKLEIFGKPQQLLSEIKELGSHQFFFLDIEIKGEQKKGMEIARKIRAKDPNATIVFVTTHSEFMPLTYRYRVSALDFIDKGLDDSAFNQVVSDVLVYAFKNLSHHLTEETFVYKTNNAYVQVPFHDILYFETSSTVHKINLKMKDGQVEFYGKISDIPKEDERLFQVHRSYVVNPENVESVDKTHHILYFENGDSCLISRFKQKPLIERMRKL